MISLGIDIGGTGCKCVAFRDDGSQLALSYREYPNPPGKENLEAEILRESVFSVIAGCVQKLNAAEVAAITVSSFGESFVPLDDQGRPLTDILLYFANSQSEAFDDLVRRVGEETFMETARILPDASYSLAKMLYTQQTAPRPVWKFLFVASYIVWCLSGETVCDESLACRSLLYDVKARCWSDQLAALSGVSLAQLPTVLPTGAIAGGLLPDAASQLGLSTAVKVVIGSHDQIVNALGAGVFHCGEAVNTTGTCECITPLFPEMPGMAFVRENFACVPYVDQLGYVSYAYNVSGGSVVKWFRDALALHLRRQAQETGVSIYDILNSVCPTEPTRLIVLPFLQGMGGTPDVDPNATGLVAGLTTATTQPDLYRAILEGLSYEMQYNLEKLQEAGVTPWKLYACGGGARSKVWLQIKADVWGREVIPVETEETGALGSAILGFAAVTGAQSCCDVAKDFVRHSAPILPDAARHHYYQAQYERYKRLREFYRNF